jgi:hypothetical protein
MTICGGVVEHNIFERDPPKDNPSQVWFNLVQWFLAEIFNVIYIKWVPFKNIVFDNPTTDCTVIKIFDHCCFTWSQNASNLKCSCMTMNSSWRRVLDTTLCDKVCQWLATSRWFAEIFNVIYIKIFLIYIIGIHFLNYSLSCSCNLYLTS